ncbi:hypothetical protein AB9K35_17910 [Leisingera sp. XS_AS12]|uniref:hypothetical protein n=1 Tax=Leisingera sp. XS_AS12 TaxID=3241294 RepID=UPI003512FF42
MSGKNDFKSQRIPVINQLAPNTVLDQGKYHVSYDSSTSGYGCQTTALVFGDSVFFVLNGDHREGYAAACGTGGKQGALDYFIAHLDDANQMSEHSKIFVEGDRFGRDRVARENLSEEQLEALKAAFEAHAPAQGADSPSP